MSYLDNSRIAEVMADYRNTMVDVRMMQHLREGVTLDPVNEWRMVERGYLDHATRNVKPEAYGMVSRRVQDLVNDLSALRAGLEVAFEDMDNAL